MNPVFENARQYVRLGYSVIPVRADGTKSPMLAWKAYQARMPTEDELERWFSDTPRGIAVVCGAISRNLEVLDFESDTIWRDWADLAQGEVPDLLERFPRARTPRGGIHLYLHLPGAPPKNQKLALDEEGQVLIETRGEGGYVLAPGGHVQAHPSGLPYRWEVAPAGWEVR